MTSSDFLVIGAGVAGASAAFELQAHGSVVLLERERLPGHHTTGRSAAFLVDSYGNEVVRGLTRASRPFFEAPPEDFASHTLTHPCPVLWIAREDQRESLAAILATAGGADAGPVRISLTEARGLCPALREDYVYEAAAESNALGLDVAGLLDAFLRGFRRRGGQLRTGAEVTRVARAGDGWEVDAGGETHRASVVVNAAGAWCDEVGRLAGARPVGLRPLRRTAITFDAPAGCDPRTFPCVIDVDEDFYVKPEGQTLLASPCDETPSSPCDASAEDYEVALAIDRLQRATTLEISHIRRRWAGLRSFVADRAPVIGMDPRRAGFFWLAGQGGFGIMTSPAASRAAASLIVTGALPADLEALGLKPGDLSPARAALGSPGPPVSVA